MVRPRTAGLAPLTLILALITNSASAQSIARAVDAQRDLKISSTLALSQQAAQQPASGRDSLWNGTLIGLGIGVGAAASLDAIFCDAEGGRCDFPWAAYLTLGGIGAGAGAGIDFLIGRNRSNAGNASLRLAPVVGRDRKGMVASVRF